ncbi:MAG: hypothetical protein IKZ55_11505 [Bacteroidales bacterium]|nr:hypothetical protein [Bacteroidales bacterium]
MNKLKNTNFQNLFLSKTGYSTHRSLDEFCKKYASRIGSRYLVYTKDLRKDGETTLAPVYMAGLL